MNFLQAKRELKKLAKGKYHPLSYTITEYSDGALSQECQTYIDGYDFSTADHWIDAIKLMQQKTNPKPVNIEPIKEVVKVK